MRPFCVMLCAQLLRKRKRRDGLYLESLALPVHGAGAGWKAAGMLFLRCGGGEGGRGNACRPSRREGVCDPESLPVYLRTRDDRALRARCGIEFVRCRGAWRDDAADAACGNGIPRELQTRWDEPGNESGPRGWRGGNWTSASAHVAALDR